MLICGIRARGVFPAIPSDEITTVSKSLPYPAIAFGAGNSKGGGAVMGPVGASDTDNRAGVGAPDVDGMVGIGGGADAMFTGAGAAIGAGAGMTSMVG